MLIKKIELQNNDFFGNAVFDFTDKKGRVMNNIVLAGENGCGKTQLLNIIYDFSRLPTGGTVSDEKRIFTVLLSENEMSQINSGLDDNSKLISPSGEMIITQDYTSQPNYWSRIRVNYILIKEDGNIETRSIDSSRLFSGTNLKSLFKSLFSTVEINYTPRDSSNVTSKEIDENILESVKSENDLATEIQQLFIDIQANDANELNIWVDENPGMAPPDTVKNRRINRFKEAFAKVFDNLNFCRISSENNKKRVLFKKCNKEVDIAALSSGEKQIVFRGAFLLRNQQSTKGSVILVDEPEISLHPLWQMKIFDYYRGLFTESNGAQTSQIFFATHSQYVLKSALENNYDTLIVRINDNGKKIEKITAPFVLPTITIAELNYEIFDIASNDYHIQLYGYLQNKIASINGNLNCSVKDCDEYILRQRQYVSTQHFKPSAYKRKNGVTNYETLPTYIRNAIDHPDSSKIFTEEELKKSIELLIELCK